MGISPIDNSLNTVMGELERMRALAKNEAPQAAVTSNSEERFSSLIRQQIEDINAAQKHAASLSQLFEIGRQDVSLVDVMIAGQKSRVAFSAMVEVRNKMLTAYQEIMNMQV